MPSRSDSTNKGFSKWQHVRHNRKQCDNRFTLLNRTFSFWPLWYFEFSSVLLDKQKQSYFCLSPGWDIVLDQIFSLNLSPEIDSCKAPDFKQSWRPFRAELCLVLAKWIKINLMKCQLFWRQHFRWHWQKQNVEGPSVVALKGDADVPVFFCQPEYCLYVFCCIPLLLSAIYLLQFLLNLINTIIRWVEASLRMQWLAWSRETAMRGSLLFCFLHFSLQEDHLKWSS